MATKISTLSIMTGTPACNLQCPFCISKQSYRVKPPKNNPLTLDRIGFLADKFLGVCDGIPYGILTGKGEPTLAGKKEIGKIISLLVNLRGRNQGLVPELQTNGILLDRKNMRFWRNKGLSTIALSCVSHLDDINSQILSGGRVKWNLSDIVREGLALGYLMRVTVTMTKGGVDSPDSVLAFLNWAKGAGVQQVTFRKMGKPRDLALPGSKKVADWIDENYIAPDMAKEALAAARKIGSLPWGDRFSYEGTSVVVTETMTPPEDGLVRSAVIQPNGHLYGSWDDPADIII